MTLGPAFEERRQGLRLRISTAFARHQTPISSLDDLLYPGSKCGKWQIKRAKRVIVGDRESVDPVDLHCLMPDYLSPKAFLYFAPVVLLDEGYDSFGFGPQKCGLCPNDPGLFFRKSDAVREMLDDTWKEWFYDDLAPICTLEELQTLRDYFKLYRDAEPQKYEKWWKRDWETLLVES